MLMMLSPLAEAKFRKDVLHIKTSSGEHKIEIEIAESSEDQSMGLMYRTSVPPGTGMLFPYETSREITMWMRNTYVSLDMVFIKADGVVHRVEHGTEPLSERIIPSKGPAKAVLELVAGDAKRLGIKAGDLVQHAVFKTARR